MTSILVSCGVDRRGMNTVSILGHSYLTNFYFFSRLPDSETPRPAGKNFRPLYDIPWLYEAREFLRKKLIGQKVSCTVDYIQPPQKNFPEKTCCTVRIGDV